MPLHFGINQHKLFLTRFLSPRIGHLSPFPAPPPLPHTCLFTIPENCTPFSDTRACFPSRQQFSQNYSCIRYNTLALHDDVLICHSRDSDNFVPNFTFIIPYLGPPDLWFRMSVTTGMNDSLLVNPELNKSQITNFSQQCDVWKVKAKVLRLRVRPGFSQKYTTRLRQGSSSITR